MSHLSVSDHLEGILSDFEALKRSFDMEDIDDAPVFSSTSPLASPFSPSQPPVTQTSNGDSQIPIGSFQPLYQSRIRISSSCSPSQSPVLKSRITSSLSFNRGTMQMAKANGTAGQGLTRVSSFQTRIHPSSFSSSGQGSDSESLHSSTSSLECPLPAKPFQSLRPTQTSVGSGITISSVTSPVLKKFSSHGNMFHSEIERPGVRLVPVASKNHGSLPSLDLHIAEDPIPDLVPSPDAGYPPSEGWSSPSPDYKRPLSRNATPISREPSFSSSSSSSPPTECTPLNCSLTSSPSPPPVFGPVHPATLQKFPVPLQSSMGRSSGSGPEQLNRPLPRTQLRVNLHSNPGVSPHQTKEKTEVAFKSQPQISPHLPGGRSPSINNFTNQVPPISGISIPAPQQQFGQEANHVNNMKPSELNTSTERLRSMMQRANSFNKADTDILQDRCAREDLVIEKSAGRVADLIKSVQETVAQEKSSFSSRIQGNGHVTSIPYAQDSPQNQRFSEESRNGVPSLNHCFRVEPKSKVKPEGPVTVSCHEEDVQRNSVEEKFKIADSLLEDLSPGPERESSGSRMMEEPPRLVRAAEDKMCEDLGREPFGYVGIDSVLEQMKRKAMKYGFEFNIMVVGQSGLGKSTLVNTLFKSKVIRKAPGAGIPKTLEMKAVSQVIEERGMEMRLTVIDTPGFGDQINNQNCWDPIIKYIHEQYEKYLREEILVNRKRRIPDSRIHSCIYFIPPTGHWLRPLDLEFMKRLGRIVNVVPVIAKADTLTLEEREEFKQRIRKDLQTHGISVYPQPELDEDPTEALLNDKIRQKIPFAVVGTDEEHQVNGKRILGRKTKWGIIEVENASHCEFADLRDLLIRSNLQDLKDITHNIHYESYRVSRLNEKMNGTPSQLKEPTSL